jgi:hypothetical protein
VEEKIEPEPEFALAHPSLFKVNGRKAPMANGNGSRSSLRIAKREELEQERRKIVEAAAGIEVSDAPGRISLRHRLISDMTRQAVEHALFARADILQFVGEFATPGVSVVEDIQYSVRSSWAATDWADRPDFWQHRVKPLDCIRSGKFPQIDRQAVEFAATRYLKLPYRVQTVERVLVDILVALELFDHGMTLYRNNALPAAGLWPFGLSKAAPGNGKVDRHGRLLRAIVRTYAHLSSKGLVRTLKVRDSARIGSGMGVTWPRPLYPILEDNLARCGRL